MGFFGDIIGAAVKVTLTPVAVVSDVVNVVTNQEVDSTKNLINDAIEDIKESGENLADGNL